MSDRHSLSPWKCWVTCIYWHTCECLMFSPGTLGSERLSGILHCSTCSLRAFTSSISPGTLQDEDNSFWYTYSSICKLYYLIELPQVFEHFNSTKILLHSIFWQHCSHKVAFEIIIWQMGHPKILRTLWTDTNKTHFNWTIWDQVVCCNVCFNTRPQGGATLPLMVGWQSCHTQDLIKFPQMCFVWERVYLHTLFLLSILTHEDLIGNTRQLKWVQ